MTLHQAREALDRVKHELHVVELELKIHYPRISVRFRVVRTLVGDLADQLRRLGRNKEEL